MYLPDIAPLRYHRRPNCPALTVHFRTCRRKNDRLSSPLSNFLGRALTLPPYLVSAHAGYPVLWRRSVSVLGGLAGEADTYNVRLRLFHTVQTF